MQVIDFNYNSRDRNAQAIRWLHLLLIQIYLALEDHLKFATEWGVHKEVYYCGNEKTFKFLERCF